MIIMFTPYQFLKVLKAHLEILNVVVALKIWGHAWVNKSIQIMCNNIDMG